jgi:hypothetical protein
MAEFKGSACIVGAGGGIGIALTRHLRVNGANGLALLDLASPALDALARETGGHAVALDARDPATVVATPPVRAESELISTMRPWSASQSRASRQHRYGVVRLIAMTSCQRARSSASSFLVSTMPVHTTSASMRGSLARAAAIAATTVAGSRASSVTA